MDAAPKRARRLRGGLAKAKGRFVLGVTVPLLLYEFLGIFVLGWAFVLMFFDYSSGRVGGPILGLGGSNPFVGIGHFVEMIQGTSVEATLFRTSLKNTLIFAFAVLPLNLAITLPLAYLLELIGDRFKALFRTIYFLPVLTSSVGVALIWLSMYNPQSWLDQCHPALLWGTARLLAVRPARRLPGDLRRHVGGHPGLPLAGLWLQHGHLHRRPAGDPAGIQGRRHDRRCQRPGESSPGSPSP